MQGKGCISFIADSGATKHVSNSHEYYTLSEKVNNKRLKSANKSSDADMIIERKGEIHVKGKKNRMLKLKNVLCTTKASRNLFSLRKIVNNGAKIVLDNTSIKILNQKDKLVKVGKFDGRFWWLEFDLINMKDRMNGAVLRSEDVKQDEVRRSDHTVRTKKKKVITIIRGLKMLN